MSRPDPVRTAGAGIMLAGVGLGFARGGWAGMRDRRPAAAAPPAGAPSLPIRLLSGALVLFGAFAFVCGLLLLLSLLISE